MFKKMPNASNLLYTMLVAVFLVGCEKQEGLMNTNNKKEKEDSTENYDTEITYPKVVVIDNCEYIQYQNYGGYKSITHKGNCKFCLARHAK